MEERVLITDIARFSVNDGPGFRTDVFIKGCPLRCAWCHNPETISIQPEIYWKKRLCVQCGACLEACPKDAIAPPIPPELSSIDVSPYHKILRTRCDRCMKCVDACRYGALQVTGNPMTVSEILDEVERDRPFYNNSGGGLTVSGGEPTAHAEFCLTLMKGAKERSLHTCLDTNGYCDVSVLREIAVHTDIILFDLKHLDPARHLEMTGVTNSLILKNLELLCGEGAEIWIRIPVVPGFNDSTGFHSQASAYLASFVGHVGRVDLLPFHNWCQDKYSWLGLDWAYRETQALDPSFLEIHAELYRRHGLKTTVGGSGFEDIGTAYPFRGCSDSGAVKAVP